MQDAHDLFKPRIAKPPESHLRRFAFLALEDALGGAAHATTSLGCVPRAQSDALDWQSLSRSLANTSNFRNYTGRLPTRA